MRFLIVAGLTLVSVLAGSAEAQSRWSFRQMTDPMTDQVRGIATVRADGYTLILKCDYGMGVYASLYEDRVAAAMNAIGPSSMRRNRSTDIMVRLDSQTPMTMQWSGDYGDYNIFDYDIVRGLARGLITANRMAVRIPQGPTSNDDISFSMAGSSAAISNVYRVCGQARP